MNSSKQRFSSNAQWPQGVVVSYNDHTVDYHLSEKEAQTVCDRLEKSGFGGDGKQFPTKTWVDHDK